MTKTKKDAISWWSEEGLRCYDFDWPSFFYCLGYCLGLKHQVPQVPTKNSSENKKWVMQGYLDCLGDNEKEME
jgi:hypothetical protein